MGLDAFLAVLGQVHIAWLFTFMACLPARENFWPARPSDPLNELKMNNSSSRTRPELWQLLNLAPTMDGFSHSAFVQRRVCVINFD